MRTRNRLGLVLGLALACAGTAVPASATSAFSQTSLDATMNGNVVTIDTVITAAPATRVSQYGACVRGPNEENLDVSPKSTDVSVSTSGTRYTGKRTFDVGRHRYYPCVQKDGRWTRVGPSKYFTVTAAASEPLLFEDNFTGPSGALPDQTKWRDYSGCANPKQAFGKIRCGNDETLTGQGQLSLPATASWGSGLSTAGKFGFTYGTYSAWIKTPRTTGYWPAFWTENRPSDFHDVSLYGETDALELYTWEPQYAHSSGTIAWGQGGLLWAGGDNYCTKPGVSNFGDAYHKYSIRIEPNRVSGYVDDVLCGSTTRSTDPKKPWPFAPDVDRPNYLILDLAVGGAGGRQPVPPNGDVMLVDRVEVRGL